MSPRPWHAGPRCARGARQAQRGVALLVAIILVAIAALLATAIAWRSTLSARRGSATFTVAQGYALAQGGEALAGYVLRASRTQDPAIVAPGQQWAQPYGPVELDAGAVFEAQLEDMAGRFNLNNVVTQATPGSPFTQDAQGVEAFTRLLELLQLKADYAGRLVDWIDADDQPTFPGGAEDGAYLAQEPAHRVPNRPITSVSELLAMGMDRASYDRLRPFVSALPPGTPLNLCTASGEVLDAIAASRSYSIDAKQLAEQRSRAKCFPDRATFVASLPPAQATQLGSRLGTTSQYFRLRAWVTLGTTRFTLYSLLQQDSNGQVRPLLRTFGTE